MRSKTRRESYRGTQGGQVYLKKEIIKVPNIKEVFVVAVCLRTFLKNLHMAVILRSMFYLKFFRILLHKQVKMFQFSLQNRKKK